MSLFIATLALVVALGANLTTYKVSQDQLDRLQAIVVQNRLSIKTFCAREHTLEDVVIGGIDVVTAERQDPNVPAATHRADDIFLVRFNKDLRAIRSDFVNPKSSCYNVRRTS